jgi:hypothetical protein
MSEKSPTRTKAVLKGRDESLAGLEFENKAQAFTHGALQARRRRAATSARRKWSSGSETAVFMLTVKPELYPIRSPNECAT